MCTPSEDLLIWSVSENNERTELSSYNFWVCGRDSQFVHFLLVKSLKMRRGKFSLKNTSWKFFSFNQGNHWFFFCQAPYHKNKCHIFLSPQVLNTSTWNFEGICLRKVHCNSLSLIIVLLNLLLNILPVLKTFQGSVNNIQITSALLMVKLLSEKRIDQSQ